MLIPDVTHRLEAAERNPANGIVWVKLSGDDGFDWMVADANAPADFVMIGGVNNGSFRRVLKTALDHALAESSK